jgi:hypothetical protein
VAVGCGGGCVSIGKGFLMASSGSGSTVLLLAAAGAAAYYAYSQGWLSSLFGSTTAAVAAPVAATPAVAATPVYTPQVVTPIPYTPAPSSVVKPIPAGVNATGGLDLAIAQSLANQGQTAAQINAAIASATAGAAGLPPGASLAGLGRFAVIGPRRTFIVFPRKGITVALPRNYRVRGVA